MSTDRDAMFKKAGEKRKQEQINETRGGGNYSIFQDYTALEKDKLSLVRMLGLPISIAGDDKYSPKISNISMIAGDDDKRFRCIWPDRSENSNWILWKVISKVLQYTWDPEKNERVYHNLSTHPSIFNKIRKNGNVDNAYEKGWEPSKFIAWNVISKDPTLYKWHKENKKTLILSKKGSVSRDGSSVFYEPGVPISVYNKILDDIVEVNGDWENYDIFIQKLAKDPYYKVFHAIDDLKKVIAKTDGGERELAKQGFNIIKARAPLTAEEMSWERHDLHKLFPITSYNKIYNRLKLTINQVDIAFNTKYLEELESLKADEDKVNASKKKEEEKASIVKPEATPEITPTVDNDTTVREPSAPARRPRPTEVFDARRVASEKGMKAFDKLTEAQVAIITGFDEVKNSFIYNTTETVYECLNADEGCTMQSPESFTHCPMCGSEF